MKLIVLGKNGQLGRAVQKQLAAKNKQFIAFSRGELDICKTTELTRHIQAIRPSIIINCAAYNDVNAAEHDPTQSLEVNHLAVSRLAEVCERTGSKLVHFSTDYVFDGSKRRPYVETDSTAPLNHYGRSKLLGERDLRQFSSNWLLLRTSWLYGDGQQNFIYRLNQWAKNKQTLKIACDEQSVPTSADDLALLTVECLDKEVSGTYHAVNSGAASRFEFAEALKSLSPSFQSTILPASSTEFASEARRPGYSVLSPRKLEEALGHPFPHWTDGLARFLRQ